MLTEKIIVTPVSLFLFAHQDDEYGVFQKIIDELHAGNLVYCAYLTDGSVRNVPTERRNSESLRVLTKIGVLERNIVFAGSILSIRDGKLPENSSLATRWIRDWFASYPLICSIYVPAWEGGHHDHDALHAITVRIVDGFGCLSIVHQFPLYNGYQCKGPFFRLLLPLPNNGPIENKRILWKDRLRFLGFCISYSSQAKSWLGLFPFVLLHYLIHGLQSIQPVSVDRISCRPHAGPLYYERRKFYTWENMFNSLVKLQ